MLKVDVCVWKSFHSRSNSHMPRRLELMHTCAPEWLRKASHRGISNATELLDAILNGSMPARVEELMRAAEPRQSALARDFSSTFSKPPLPQVQAPMLRQAPNTKTITSIFRHSGLRQYA